MSIFTGAGVAIVTPMFENGEIDFDSYGRLIDFQIENGTDAIIPCGTTGESATLSHDEHIEVIKYCVEKTNGRVPVVAGTGSNSTKEAIYLSKKAVSLGADGLLIITPYYNKASQTGLYEHFKAIAKECDLPIILYNVPGRTGCNLLPETTMKLVNDVDNIVAIKAATGDIAQETKLASLANGKIDMYSGEDGLILPLLSLGAKGVISVLSNIAPQNTHNICEEYFKGNIENARKLQLEAIELIDALFCEVNPIPVKTALNIMGLCGDTMRLPLSPMQEDTKRKLLVAMKNYGLI